MTIEVDKKTIYLKDYQSPSWRISHVRLHIAIGDHSTEVTAELDISKTPQARSDESFRLHGAELELLALEINGQPVPAGDYGQEGEELIIRHVPSEPFTLKSRVRIYPERNTALEGLYASNGMYCTQCEAEGFRKITYYLDRPDVMAKFTTTIVADKARFPVLLANGNLTAAGDLEEGRHFATWNDPFPKPAYLFAAVAGDLACKSDKFVTASGRHVDLRIYVESHDLEKVDHAMSSLKRSMRWDEEVYGREYDLDVFMIVAVSHFNMGAMENKGLNIFNTSCVLAHPATTTDTGFQRVESVVAHEYFHNWSGNRVTCRDWFQLSLKEGFTVFRDQQFSADMLSAGVQRIEDVNMLRTWQFTEDSGPLAHPVRPESFVEINNFYTATVYEKGAEIVRMLHTVLGRDKFRAGTDLYFSRHDGQAVTVEDFIAALADASGVDLSAFMQWYRQPGTPVLRATGTYNPEASTYTLQLMQSVPITPGFPEPVSLPVPIRMALLRPDGHDMMVTQGGIVASEHVLLLQSVSQTFVFHGVSAPPVPSLLRDFSAPVRLEPSLSAEDRLFLLRHDRNGVNRWLVAQDLLTEELLRLAGEGGECNPSLISAMTDMLPALAAQDAALAAKMLQFPSVQQLMGQAQSLSPDKLQWARQALRAAVTTPLEAWLLSLCQQPMSPPYVYSADAMAHRALANTALGFLVDFNPQHAVLARQRFTHAQNMTDEAAALTALVHAGRPEASVCLERFLARWQHEALVTDQWFAIQASAPLPATAAHVQQLLTHPMFDRDTPNRVRALLGQFANANPVAFHREDGSGYRLLCEQVGELDTRNPQLAARLLGAMSIWPKLDAGRRAHAVAALESLGRNGLSADLSETLERLQQAGKAH